MTFKTAYRWLYNRMGALAESYPNAMGVVLILLSGVAFTALGVCMRWTAEYGYHSTQVAFLRSGGGVCFALMFFVSGSRRTWADFKLTSWKMVLLRGFFAGTAVTCGTYAIAHLPFAEVTAVSFTVPILLTICAGVIFKEAVGIRRATAVVVGFLGVYIILNPSQGGDMSLGKWALVAFAFLATASQVCGKILCRDNPTTLVVMYGAMGMVVVTFLLSRPYWQAMDMQGWIFLATMGFFGHLGQWTMAQSIRLGEIAVVMPFDYVRLLYGIMAGYYVFGEVVQDTFWLGATLIIGGAGYTAYREYKLNKQVALKAKTTGVSLNK